MNVSIMHHLCNTTRYCIHIEGNMCNCRTEGLYRQWYIGVFINTRNRSGVQYVFLSSNKEQASSFKINKTS